MERYRVKKTWTRKTVTKRINIARVDANDPTRHYYKQSHNLDILVEGLTGEFEVTIDIDAIVAELAGRAAYAKTGRSSTFHGRIKAKRLTQTVLTHETEHHPIPKDYSEVKQQEGSDNREAVGA